MKGFIAGLALVLLALAGCSTFQPIDIYGSGGLINANRSVIIQAQCDEHGATSCTASVSGPFLLVEQVTSVSLGYGRVDASVGTKSKNASSFYATLAGLIFGGTGAAVGGPAGGAIGGGGGALLGSALDGKGN